ncbi:response regulator transcription factor [bacterium]|nr:response regulator transcription factor [bacterium]
MSKARLLIIDDDSALGQRLVRYLNQFDYTADAAVHPADALKRLEQTAYDLVILDVMLPDMDGFEVLRRLRGSTQVPVIMLTARGDVADRIVGLELGADDYLPKPFEPRELVARIQTVLRRGSLPDTVREGAAVFGDLVIDARSERVTIAGKEAGLTHLEFRLLAILADRQFHIVPRDRLLDLLRGVEWDAFDRSIDVLVSRLRQKLEDDPAHPRYIKTVRGSGYMFIGGGETIHDR